MIKQHNARAYRLRRKRRVRLKINGTPLRQRLSVFRSGKHIYAHLPEPVDGADGLGENHKVRVAVAVGRLIGERAQATGVTKVAFDRSGFIYHGRVKALADAARAAGLDF